MGHQKKVSHVHPKNFLNDLTGREWVKATKSWFILDAVKTALWKKYKEKHVGTFPYKLAEKQVLEYTKRGMVVFDPMVGSGSTLVAAAAMTGRRGIGIDLYKKNRTLFDNICKEGYPEIYHSPDAVFHVGDSLEVMETMATESIDYCLFSPPYVNTLHKSSGGVHTRHKQRIKDGLDIDYGDDPRDLGNTTEDVWLAYLRSMAREISRLLRSGPAPGRMTIICQNLMRTRINPIAWKLGLMISEMPEWEYEAERIWAQDSKQLGIWGHPRRMLSSNHHHYVMTFVKVV